MDKNENWLILKVLYSRTLNLSHPVHRSLLCVSFPEWNYTNSTAIHPVWDSLEDWSIQVLLKISVTYMSVKRTLLVLKFAMPTASSTVVSLSSLELISFAFVFLPPSNSFILHKTTITQSLFLKIRNYWVELSPAEILPGVVTVCGQGQLLLWSAGACSPSWPSDWALGCLAWFLSLSVCVCHLNSVWSVFKIGTNYRNVREQSYNKANVDPAPSWDFTIYLFWKAFET